VLSVEQVAQLYPRASVAHRDAFVAAEEALFGRFGLAERPIRLHFFLAQIGHESGGLTVAEENLDYSAERLREVWPRRFPDLAAARPFARNPQALANAVYAGRMGNGDAASGDGFRYRGRGYIQITGRDGYRRVGTIAGLDLEGDPDQAAAPQHALLVACAFWQWKELNPFCDLGDFRKVTRRINGGLTGLADRSAWLDKVRRLVARPEDVVEPPDVATVIAMQRALQARGYREIGAADGDIGSRTIAGIQRFRQENGLPDGLVDAALLIALGVAVA
jgi:putative chitinase